MRSGFVIAFLLLACGSRADNTPRTKPYPPGSGRPKAIACETTRPPGNADPANDDGSGCKKDDDCTSGKNGRCQLTGSRVEVNRCTYDACSVDGDCKSGGPCECSPSGNTCLSGKCRIDADCGANGACGQSTDLSCGDGRVSSYYCRTPADTCLAYDDCKNGTACVYSAELGHWACQAYPKCPVG
jgi:hypothetical protein